MKSNTCFQLILICSLLFTSLNAQEAYRLKVGDEVLISARDIQYKKLGEETIYSAQSTQFKKILGTISIISSDTLYIMPPNRTSTLLIPITNINKLEVKYGKKRNTKKGAIMGFIFGIGPAIFVSTAIARSNDPPLKDEEKLAWTFIYSAVFTLAGAGIGALIGSQSSSDNWKKVPPDKIKLGIYMPKDKQIIMTTVSYKF
jgi:hypothetical protein